MSVTPEQLTEIIEKLNKAKSYQSGAWLRVIESARKYAMMKTHGVYLDNNGCTVSVSHSDRHYQEQYYADDLLREACRAFLEDALVGSEIANL